MEYSNKIIEDLFQKFKPAMGADHHKYKNHVYRVFLNCLLMDSEKNTATLSTAYEKRFKVNKKAWTFFKSLSPYYQKLGVHRVMDAK